MVYSDSQVLLIHWVTLIAALLSTFGSAFILVSYFLFGRGKGLTKLIIYLAIGDFGWGFSVVINNILLMMYGKLDDAVCFMFRGVFQFFAGSTVMWTLWISIFLYRSVFRKPSLTINDKIRERNHETALMVFFHVVGWGEPLAVCIYCYAAGIFAQATDGIGLCYPDSNAVHFWFWFFPIIVCFFFSLLVYVLLIVRLAKITSWRFIFKTFTLKTTTISLPFRVSVYLLIFLLCWSLDIVQFILGKFKTQEVMLNFVILVTYSFLLQAQGALDCVVYGISNKEFRKQYTIYMTKWGKNGTVYMIIFVLISPLLVLPALAFLFFRHFALPREREDTSPLVAPTTNDEE